MRSIRSAGAALTLAGIATFAGAAVPAFAAGPQIDVFPSVAAPGQSVSFSAACVNANGSDAATSATLFGTTLGLSEHIPMSPATHKGVFQQTVTVPAGTMPGTYSLSIDCSNGMSGTGTLTVRAAVKPVVPNNAPMTGDGITSTAVGGSLTAIGVGVLGLSGLVGALAIRRRKANSSK